MKMAISKIAGRFITMYIWLRFLLIYNALKLRIIIGKNKLEECFIQLRAVPVGTALGSDGWKGFVCYFLITLTVFVALSLAMWNR